MALLFMDGFDDGLWASKWGTQVGTPVPDTGRTGQGLQLPTLQAALTAVGHSLGADEDATIIVGAALSWNWNGMTTGNASAVGLTFASDAGDTFHILVWVNTNGRLQVNRGTTFGMVLGTSAVPFPTTGFTYVEAKVTLGDSTNGAVEVRQNGVAVINITGVDTKNAGTKSVFDTVWVAGMDRSAGSAISTHVVVDDLYICNTAGTTNNDFLGDVTVETLYPSGAGANAGFAVTGAAANWDAVNEAGTPSGTDYVSSATAGVIDSYTFADLATASGTVKGVQVGASALKSDAGPRTLATYAKLGANTTTGPQLGLGTTAAYVGSVLETKPGGGAWTIADVNSAEFGVTVAS